MSKEFEKAINITYFYYLNDTKIVLHFMAFGHDMAKQFIRSCIETYHYKVVIDNPEIEDIVSELFYQYFEIENKGE